LSSTILPDQADPLSQNRGKVRQSQWRVCRVVGTFGSSRSGYDCARCSLQAVLEQTLVLWLLVRSLTGSTDQRSFPSDIWCCCRYGGVGNSYSIDSKRAFCRCSGVL